MNEKAIRTIVISEVLKLLDAASQDGEIDMPRLIGEIERLRDDDHYWTTIEI